MNFKSVSVVIPCYNKKKALRKTLSNTVSLLDYENGDELIVSDGKSSPAFADINRDGLEDLQLET